MIIKEARQVMIGSVQLLLCELMAECTQEFLPNLSKLAAIGHICQCPLWTAKVAMSTVDCEGGSVHCGLRRWQCPLWTAKVACLLSCVLL